MEEDLVQVLTTLTTPVVASEEALEVASGVAMEQKAEATSVPGSGAATTVVVASAMAAGAAPATETLVAMGALEAMAMGTVVVAVAMAAMAVGTGVVIAMEVTRVEMGTMEADGVVGGGGQELTVDQYGEDNELLDGHDACASGAGPPLFEFCFGGLA